MQRIKPRSGGLAVRSFGSRLAKGVHDRGWMSCSSGSRAHSFTASVSTLLPCKEIFFTMLAEGRTCVEMASLLS